MARYNEHVRRRAAGDVGPIKTIPKPQPSHSRPADPMLALDTMLLVTSKVMPESEFVRVRNCSPTNTVVLRQLLTLLVVATV